MMTPWFRRREVKVRPDMGRPVRNAYRPRIELLEPRLVLSNMVQPGQSIQAAVDAAPATGAVITIEPGTYQQTVTVAKPGIQLIGLEDSHGHGVVIQNPGGQPTGIAVTAAGTGFVLRDVTVRNFGENGVTLTGVDGFVLSEVTAVNDGEYGLFPEFSSHGLIEDSTASGSRDTGIYVGQSHDVVIADNTVYLNVNGIEIENSSRVQALANESYNNTAGILVDLLPGLTVTLPRTIFLPAMMSTTITTPTSPRRAT